METKIKMGTAGWESWCTEIKMGTAGWESWCTEIKMGTAGWESWCSESNKKNEVTVGDLYFAADLLVLHVLSTLCLGIILLACGSKQYHTHSCVGSTLISETITTLLLNATPSSSISLASALCPLTISHLGESGIHLLQTYACHQTCLTAFPAVVYTEKTLTCKLTEGKKLARK